MIIAGLRSALAPDHTGQRQAKLVFAPFVRVARGAMGEDLFGRCVALCMHRRRLEKHPNGTAPRFIRVFCSLSTLNLVVDLEDRIGNEIVAVWHLDFWQAVLVELSIRGQDFVQA